MTLNLKELRFILDGVPAGYQLHAGHLADDTHTCDCAYIFDDGHAGGIAQVLINNGLPVSEGGNDAPQKDLAKAYLRLLVAAANALPELLDMLEERNGS